MAPIPDREEAQRLVQEIFVDHGFVDKKDWDAMEAWDKATKHRVQYAMLRKDKIIGATAITVAKTLYSSDVRFLFELLQNFDDNHYSRAAERGEEPQVLFKVYSDRVITECNEDGFTADHLKAICNIGRSSKQGSQAYVGEKGIGFKSVFKVASKAIIQSGHFAFSFTHEKDDPGMGMISPTWESKVEPLDATKTRITLMLRQDDDAQGVVQSINEQFNDLREEMLLFMRRLKKITVHEYGTDGLLTAVSSYTTSGPKTGFVNTEMVKTMLNRPKEHKEKHFYLFRHTATDLPENENRKYDENTVASQSYAMSEIVLAFPLTKESVPLLENQFVFSFLPVYQTTFKFVIQADFVTSGARESIEITSKRNLALRDHIAPAFVAAIKKMCDHETLQYQWMRYVPLKDDGSAWGPFWSQVIADIADALKDAAILRPHSGGPLRTFNDLKLVTNSFLDQHGIPLFPDIPPELYLCTKYAARDQTVLRALGLRGIIMEDILARVRHDLDLDSETSLMKSPETSPEWHRRASLLLQLPFKAKWGVSAIKRLKVVPLRNEAWISIHKRDVYYPEVGSLTIPDGIDLDVVDTEAATHTERRRLFDALGVQTASIEFVRTQIQKKYQQPSFTVKDKDGIAQLQFLYLTHNNQSRVAETTRIWLSNGSVLQDPTKNDMYLTSEDPLSPKQLLAKTLHGPDPDNGAPGFEVTFIRDQYVTSPPSNPPAGLPTWVDWLHDTIHIRRDLRLKDKSGDKVSEAVIYVAKHRPAKFMPLLNRLWGLQGAELRETSAVMVQLRNIEVLCRGERRLPLKDTFLPTAANVEIVDRFLDKGDPFRWLQVEDESKRLADSQVWGNLATGLDIGMPHNNVELGLAILEHIKRVTQGEDTDTIPQDVYNCYVGSAGHKIAHELYVFLEAHIRGAVNHMEMIEFVRARMSASPLIFLPNGSRNSVLWRSSGVCVWTAPVKSVKSKVALRNLYSDRRDVLASSSPRYSLEVFFRDIVQVPKWTWEDTIREIKHRRDGKFDFDILIDLYKDLAKANPEGRLAENIRHEFATKKLIFCPRSGGGERMWETSRNCLWTMETNIPGKVAINNDGDYNDLEDFFLKTVGVQTLTLRMLYDKLEMSDSNVSIQELKSDLTEFSALLSTPDSDKDLQRLSANGLRDKPIFPVRQPDGQIVRRCSNDYFAIADRASLELLFRDEVDFLDFGMDEIRSLSTLLEWVGLESRYLSHSVKEIFTSDRTSSRPISEPHRDIRRKAGAILRIAAACGSPRTANGNLDEFYQWLRGCETLETDKIHTTLSLTFPDADPITREKDAGIALFINDSTGSLKVYIPRNKADRDACFLSKLPRHFLEWIMSNQATNIPGTSNSAVSNVLGMGMITVTQAVLSAHPASLKGILDEFGVPELDDRFDDEVEDEVDQDDGDDIHRDYSQQNDNSETQDESFSTQLGANDESHVRSPLTTAWSETENGDPILTPTASRTSTSRMDNHDSDMALDGTVSAQVRLGSQSARAAVLHQPPEASPTPIPQYAPQAAVKGLTPYRALLERVVERARSVVFPSHGSFDMSAIAAALSGNSGTDPAIGLPFLATFGRLERDKMVGAAGELFVYELLRRIEPELPGFGIDNWKSNIRGYVEAHPDYTNVSSWAGYETADLTYCDDTGALTSFLADKGYLTRYDVERLQRAKPTYYLEVKSTPYRFETSFFMSRRQYERMQSWSQSVPGQEDNLSHVYIILRVFHLGKDSASVRVLVDPEGMRSRNELSFEAETWRIRPAG